MSRQDQRVEAEGIAVQGGRDVVLNLGPAAEDFARLMIEMGKQLAVFHAEGQAKVEERLELFRQEVLKEFAAGTAAAPEALKDPDFQAVLSEAQKNFVRNDDEDVAASLINLISERSQQTQRSRVSLSLNAAIEVMGSLTAEDIAVLSVLFHSNRAIIVTSDPGRVYDYLGTHIGPHIGRLPANSGSLDYLVSKGCLTLNPFSGLSFVEAARANYGCALAEDFALGDLSQAVPGIAFERLQPLIVAKPVKQTLDFSITAMPRPSDRYRFNHRTPGQVRDAAHQAGLGEHADQLHAFAESRLWPAEEAAERLFKAQPILQEFAELWAVSNMGRYHPTPLGVAVAHSNARRLFDGFKTPLSVWIF